MPVENNFQHAKYSRSDPGERVLYPEFQEGDSWSSPGWQKTMADTGKRMVQAGVRGVLFVNSFPYSDLFGVGRLDEVGGLKRGYSRGIPGLESLLTLLRPETNGIADGQDAVRLPLANDPETHEQLDLLTQDTGNFSNEYVFALQRAVEQNSGSRLSAARYLWSGLNHHVGRVKAALDLVEYLQTWARDLRLSSEERLLLHAHGHAGLVLSLLSNLIAPGDALNREIIFEILAGHHERTHDPALGAERLEGLYRTLTDRPFLGGVKLDIITYGMPVRGGWETSSIGHLLHFVYHRPLRGDGKRWLAKMELPQIAWEIPMLAGGDYVQQLAVAGTDSSLESEQDDLVNQELREILEPYDGFERWLECVRRGTRCQNDGTCLLVDYRVNGEVPPRTHLYGHAIYTRKHAMLFHTSQIVAQLY